MHPYSSIVAPKSAGFTLLELLVVMVLGAIAVGVVGGGAQSFMERARYHQAVRDVAGHLGKARALCVQEGRSVGVVYLPETRSLIVDGQSHLQLPDSVEVHWQPAAHSAAMPAGKALQGHPPIFVFNANGGARGGVFSVLRGGVGTAFQVNWLLGTVEQSPVASSS